MKPPIIIGRKVFKYKKDALSYFKTILNSYDFDRELNESDEKDVIALLLENETKKDKIGVGIKTIRITKVQYGTKSFEIIRKDLTSELFSYILCINGDRSPFTKFSVACKNAVYKDFWDVKKRYFEQY